MRFSADTEDALAFVVALVNTVPAASSSGADELTEPAELVALLDEHGYSGRRDGDAAELAEVRVTRDRLRRLWSLDEEGVVDEVNRMLEEAAALPRLTRHDALGWHIHATRLDAPLAERIRVEAAMAFVDVVRGGAIPLLRGCGADDCEGVFLDQSKNGSRRFCSVRCGNRMNVNAYRERRRGAAD